MLCCFVGPYRSACTRVVRFRQDLNWRGQEVFETGFFGGNERTWHGWCHAGLPWDDDVMPPPVCIHDNIMFVVHGDC